MSSNDGLGEDMAEGGEELSEGGFLCWGTCVLRLAVVVSGKPSDVADADGVGVVSLGVRSWRGDGTASLDGSVEVDDEVIADVSPSVVAYVPLADVGSAEVLALGGG